MPFDVLSTEVFCQAPESDTTLVYLPGFGDNEPTPERLSFLGAVAESAQAEGIMLARSNQREIGMLRRSGASAKIRDEYIEKISAVDKDLILLPNSFATGIALDVAEALEDRVKSVLLITPAIGDFEAVTKGVLHSGMGLDEDRVQRIWGKFHETNRSVFCLEERTLPVLGSFYLTGDTVINLDNRLKNDMVIESGEAGHFDWEKSDELKAALQLRVMNLI